MNDFVTNFQIDYRIERHTASTLNHRETLRFKLKRNSAKKNLNNSFLVFKKDITKKALESHSVTSEFYQEEMQLYYLQK